MQAYTLIKATAAGTLSVSFPSAVELLQANTNAGFAVVSGDPNVTTAQFSSAAADGNDRNVICLIPSGGVFVFPEPFPIQGAETVYCAFSAKGSLTLYYRDLKLRYV